VDASTGRVSVDSNSVPVVDGCSDGQVVMRTATGWSCAASGFGPKGDAGATGPQGIQGDTGATGSMGPQGEKGDSGVTGSQGPKGEPGSPGIPGESVIGESLPDGSSECPYGGAKYTLGGVVTSVCNGEPGLAGATGPQGVVGLKGDTDTKGDTGTFDPSMPLAGDLSGTLASALVAKVQGVSVSATAPGSGQVMRFDGTSWSPASLGTLAMQSSVSNSMLDHSDITIAAGAGIATGGTVSLGGSMTLSLASSPAAGTYSSTPSSITIDSVGRVTAATASGVDLVQLAARVTQLEADRDTLFAFKETVDNRNCPLGMGFTYDPDDSPGIVCKRKVAVDGSSDGATDEMVKVGDFWIDRFEMFKCSGDAGSPPGYDVTSKTTGRTTAKACSRRGVQPLAAVTWFQTAQLCANAGKRLCTNAEWQTAVSGTPDPADGSDADHGPSARASLACNVNWNAGEAPYGGSVRSLANTMAHADCVSRFGAFDMIGNVWEWVADWAEGGTTWMSATSSLYGSWPDGYGSDATANVNGQTAMTSGWIPGLPAATFRGGSYSDRNAAGAFALHWDRPPAHAEWTTGARCCVGGR